MSLPTPNLLPPPYARTAPPTGIDLWLDGNEGPALAAELVDNLATGLASAELWRRYPDDGPLRERLAARFGIASSQVVLGAGADELLDRICRAWLAPGRSLVAPVPCFPMLPRYVQAAGATLTEVPWTHGALDLEQLWRRAAGATVLALTTPNNPTGLAIATDDLLRTARRVGDALLVVDLAYVDYADEDPTPALLREPNVLVVRTFSKGRSLAGLRVGYALGSEPAVAALRATGSPYPCSTPSLLLCERLLDADRPEPRLARIRDERERLAVALASLDLTVLPSQANFVYATAATRDQALALARRLAARGIAVRSFPADGPSATAVRITCPGDDAAFTRLVEALLAGGRP
jgi:histidinol-phosphate aminotransferase